MLKLARRRSRRSSIDPAPGTTAANGVAALFQLDSPADVHYVTARICLSPRASKWTGAGLLGLCYLLVILQGNVAVILMQTMGNTHGLCIDSSDCGRRLFCTDSPHPTRTPDSGLGLCLECPLLPMLQDACASDGSIKASVKASGILTCQEAGCKNAADAISGQWPLVVNGTARHAVLELACARCVHAQRGYLASAQRINIRGMDSFEWLVLLMVALVAACTVAEEYAARSKLLIFYMRHPWDGLQQTILEHTPSRMASGAPIDSEAVHALDTAPTDAWPPPSEALAEARANRMAPSAASLEGGGGVADEDRPSPGTLPPAYWRVKRYAIAFLQHIRAVMSLLVVTCVPLFVLRDRTEPVSLILNAVAVLFILEADNLVLSLMDASIVAEHLTRPLTVHGVDMANVEQQKRIAVVATMIIVLAVPLADGALAGPEPDESYAFL